MSGIGDRVKNRRISLNMTQDDLAKILGYRSRASINKIELGINDITQSRIVEFAKALHTTPSYLMGWDEADPYNSPDIIPYTPGKRIPIYGCVKAGYPALADECLEGYDYADVSNSDDYFFLRVNGDSMINAAIHNGDLVLVQKQTTAENGQIVVCLVNGDEATLKRFHRQGDMVVLQPENSAFAPVVVPCKDFDTGYARILGVAKKVVRNL